MLPGNIIYLDQIFIHNNKLHLKVMNDSEVDLYLKSKNNLIKISLEDDFLDLEKFIEDNFENILREDKYRIVSISKNEEIEPQAVEYVKGHQYICKNKTITHNGVEFQVNVYVKDGVVKIEIIDKAGERVIANVNGANICDNNLEVEFEFIKLEDDTIRNSLEKLRMPYIIGDEAVKLILRNTDFMYQSVEVNGNIAKFNINLEDLVSVQEGNYVGKITIGGNKVSFSMEEELRLKKVLADKENNFERILYVNILDNEFSFRLCDHFIVDPKITDIEFNNDITIYGDLNCDTSISAYKNVDMIVRLVSSNKSFSYPKEAVINGSEFKITLSSKELFEIRDMFNGNWSLQGELFVNDNQVFSTSLAPDASIILSGVEREKIKYNRYILYAGIALDKKTNTFSLVFDNPTSIDKIVKIRVKKNKISFRLRTKKKIVDDINALKAKIKVEEFKIPALKIEKNGAKTFTMTFEVAEMDKFIKEMTLNGMTLIQDIHGERFMDNISDVDKNIIRTSFKDEVLMSRKYKKICMKLYNKVFLKVRINNKKIMFESFLGRNCSGNPKYIYEQMVKDGLDKKYDIYWIFNDTNEEIIGNAKKVSRKSLSYYYHMATSKYWVFNTRQGNEIIKRKENVYLQTWHGTPLKKLGMDMDSVNMAGQQNINDYKDTLYRNTRRWDYLISENDYSTEIFKRCFAFDKKMLDYGYPANDILYNDNNSEKINELKDKFNLPKDKKVVLYAPTWRDNNFMKKGHYKMDIQLNLEQMQKELGDEYIVLLRMHYLIMNSINIENYKGFVYDFSQGFDIQELYLISDVLITDYSSVMFDYSNLDRQVIFFAYDIEDYRDSLRGFYFDFEDEAPGPIVKTTDEVIYALSHLKEVDEEYKEKKKAFYDKFCHIDDGHAAERVIKEVFK